MSLRLARALFRVVAHPWVHARSAWFRRVHQARPPHDVIARRDGVRLKVRSNSVFADAWLGRWGFEAGEQRALRALLAPGQRVLDVGANVGLYTVIMARAVGPAGHVWSFEPSPATAARLQENVRLNRLQNVTVAAAAVGETEGEVELLEFPDGQDVYNSVGARERPAEGVRAVRGVRVPAVTLDAYAAREGIKRVSVLKVDVEGAEERVLRGAVGLLRRSPGVVVLAEMYEPGAAQCGCSTAGAVELMASLGFGAAWVQPDGSIGAARRADGATEYAIFRRG